MIAAASWSDWVWWGSGWGLVAAAGVVVLWALVWDRARGRLRCPSCWYDMRGVGVACPECGRVVKSERSLRRTRRRWGWAVAALVLVVAGTQVADQPTRVGEGWTRCVPTTVLVFMARPGEYAGVATSRTNRAIDGRDVRGWRGAVAEWVTLELDGENARMAVSTRRKWPAGTPIELRAVWTPELEPMIGGRLLKVARRGAPDEVAALRVNAWPHGGSYDRPADTLILGAMEPGTYVEPVVVSVSAFGWEIGRWDVDVAFEVVPTIDEAVAPLVSEELTARVRGALAASGSPNPEDNSIGYGLWWRARDRPVEPFGWCALRVDVIVDGKVVLSDLTDDDYFSVATPSSAAHAPADKVVIADGDDVEAFARSKAWIRVRGDQRGTMMRRFEADAYWAGTLDVALSELLGDAP